MSSDNPTIAEALSNLEHELMRVVLAVDDAWKLSNYFAHVRAESINWSIENNVDMRHWQDNARYRKS